MGLVAFTDGSFSIDDGDGARSGFAVVLCRLEDVLRPGFRPEKRCVVLSGTALHAVSPWPSCLKLSLC